MSFPKGFVWGAAASAYQIEGALREDGRGEGVWDGFCRWEGKTYDGHSGEVACDHYHRYREDVALMKQMGLKAYRFSVGWPRILPQGEGQVNEKGLAFYDRLIDALLEAGIEPMLTLFHWDLPLALHQQGGWLNRRSPEWFARYAEVLAKRFGGRVKWWMTLNEPQVLIPGGYAQEWHAPGLRLPMGDLLRVAHHLMMAHGRAVAAIRQNAGQAVKVGLAAAGIMRYPASDRAEDVAAARRAMFGIKGNNFWNTAWMVDPIVHGRYPEEIAAALGESLPRFDPADLKVMCQPMDFYGANIYHGMAVKAGEEGEPELVKYPVGQVFTSMDWPVTPPMLYWGPKLLHERTGLPIFMTENGLSNADWVATDGGVHDAQRIDYVRRHLLELRRAMADGVPVQGYLYWSVMDNFEWQMGYRQRFGLVHVDYGTQRRTPKDSARWYAEVIASNGSNL